MRYISTRGQAASLPFCDILLGGLAPDGGLYLPEQYPQVSRTQLDAWRGLSYPELAFAILSLFADDIPPDDLRRIVAKTYTGGVYRHSRVCGSSSEITPLIRLSGGLFIQELSNGPTLAFKDIALQLLGNLFEYELERRGETMNILGATSGDTGSAAEYAMLGKRGIRVFMLSPHGKGMTPFQAAQMYALRDPGIFNIAVNGVFDDAQAVVKDIFGDAAFKARYKLGAVNSINWARVAAQIVYYFWGYFRATKGNDEQVSFAVPTGNFGNICAGHIARMMGLPIDRLILATNENDVLHEFFHGGIYCPRPSKEAIVTTSPSMDITKASNFERFMFDLLGRDPALIRELWKTLGDGKAIDISGTRFWKMVPGFGIVSARSVHRDRIDMIRTVFQRHSLIIDTHTADGFKAALEFQEQGQPMIVLETARAAKFGAAITEALGIAPDRPSAFEGLEELPQRVAYLDPQADLVRTFIAMRADA